MHGNGGRRLTNAWIVVILRGDKRKKRFIPFRTEKCEGSSVTAKQTYWRNVIVNCWLSTLNCLINFVLLNIKSISWGTYIQLHLSFTKNSSGLIHTAMIISSRQSYLTYGISIKGTYSHTTVPIIISFSFPTNRLKLYVTVQSLFDQSTHSLLIALVRSMVPRMSSKLLRNGTATPYLSA